MAWQNRQTLNWVIGVCVIFQANRCNYVPNNTAPDEAMEKLNNIKITENVGGDTHIGN